MESRRDFLRQLPLRAGGTIIAAQTALSPSILFADLGLVGPEIDLELRVDRIDGDYLSRNFHETGKDSILYKSMEGLVEFFAHIGHGYGLPGLKIDLAISDEKLGVGETKANQSEVETAAGPIAFYSIDKLLDSLSPWKGVGTRIEEQPPS